MFTKIISKLFGGPSVDFKNLVDSGAVIIDVRSREEYRQGHIKNSINLSLDSVEQNLSRLDKNKVIITCCASGMRSGKAQSILKKYGFEVYNGGNWYRLESKIQ